MSTRASTNRKAPTAKRQVAKAPAMNDQEKRLAERRARIQARASVLPAPDLVPVVRRPKDDDRIVDPDEMPSHSGDSMGWLTER
jgi:hypothetical protein